MGDLTSVRLFKIYDIISYEEFINLQELVLNAYTQFERSEIVRNFFLNKGYDAFLYENKFEDSEDKHSGLCVFNPDKIRRIIQVDKETLQPINERITGDNMIKLMEYFYPELYNGKTLDKAPLDSAVTMNLCLLVDDSPYLIADKKGKLLRIFVDWIDRTDLWNKRKIIGGEFESTYNLYFKPTADEIKLVRLLRKLTKFPNGRVIL